MHLNRAANSTSRMVERQIKAIIREMAEKDSLMIRNGRKVIPIKKWIKLAKTKDFQFIRRYLPDRIVNMHVLPRNIATRIMEDKEWKNDYRDVLWEKEDPHLGHMMCENCVMSPESNADPVIAAIFAKGLELEFYSSCTTMNCFECPSKKLSKDVKVFEYADYAKYCSKYCILRMTKVVMIIRGRLSLTMPITSPTNTVTFLKTVEKSP